MPFEVSLLYSSALMSSHFMEGEFSLLEVLGDSRLRLQALVYTPESLESRDLMDGGVDCTTAWRYLMALKCTLTNGWSGTFFMLSLFYNKNREISFSRMGRWSEFWPVTWEEISHRQRLKKVSSFLEEGCRVRCSLLLLWAHLELSLIWNPAAILGPARDWSHHPRQQTDGKM